jgi:inositol oxygenase
MGIWEAAEYLNKLVDDSDPDTDMSQLEHLLQTAEQLRRDGQAALDDPDGLRS